MPRGGAVRDDLVLEALVDESLTDGSAGLFGDLVQQDDARSIGMGVRGQDDDRDDQSKDIHSQSALAAGHALGRVMAARVGGDPGGHMDTRNHSTGPFRLAPWCRT